MPKRMVNGCYQKINKFCKCGKLLTGHRSRYCSRSCYEFQRKEFEREHYAATHPPLPDKKCVECGKDYRPRVTRQLCCSTYCRGEMTRRKAREKTKLRKKKIKPTKWWQTSTISKNSPVIKVSVLSPDNSKHQNEITKYLEGGGKVTVLPPQENGRVPSVNIPLNLRKVGPVSSYSWGIDTAMGHGYELDIMEEIYTTQEVLDEP